MSKVLFNHLERCHYVLISPKHMSEHPGTFKVLFNHFIKLPECVNFPKAGGPTTQAYQGSV